MIVAPVIRRWFALSVAVVGWLLIASDPEILNRTVVPPEVVGLSSTSWVVVIGAAIVLAIWSVLRPSLLSVSVAGSVPVAVGVIRGVTHASFGAWTPLGVWMIVTALVIEVTWRRLEGVG